MIIITCYNGQIYYFMTVNDKMLKVLLQSVEKFGHLGAEMSSICGNTVDLLPCLSVIHETSLSHRS